MVLPEEVVEVAEVNLHPVALLKEEQPEATKPHRLLYRPRWQLQAKSSTTRLRQAKSSSTEQLTVSTRILQTCLIVNQSNSKTSSIG